MIDFPYRKQRKKKKASLAGGLKGRARDDVGGAEENLM
jgi:hypothetical protein